MSAGVLNGHVGTQMRLLSSLTSPHLTPIQHPTYNIQYQLDPRPPSPPAHTKTLHLTMLPSSPNITPVPASSSNPSEQLKRGKKHLSPNNVSSSVPASTRVPPPPKPRHTLAPSLPFPFSRLSLPQSPTLHPSARPTRLPPIISAFVLDMLSCAGDSTGVEVVASL